MGLITNLLGQPSGRSISDRLLPQGRKKAERTIKIFSAGKGNNKKRNRQIFLTVSAFFLRAYARCGPEDRLNLPRDWHLASLLHFS